MIRPDAIPLRLAHSRAVLTPTGVHALFGDGYTLRGSEQVFVARSTQREVPIAVEVGSAFRVVLDALDRHALGEAPSLRLRGPAGSVEAPTVEPVRRVLALPPGLVRAWGLTTGQTVTVQAGPVAFGDVNVNEGEGFICLDRADALAAGLKEGDTARWARDVSLSVPTPLACSSTKVRPTGRVVTETDVRQARLKGQRIVIRPGQIVTPAARSLGRELGILDEA